MIVLMTKENTRDTPRILEPQSTFYLVHCNEKSALLYSSPCKLHITRLFVGHQSVHPLTKKR